MLCQGKLRPVIRLVRFLSASSKVYANHYDVLGITPKATQSDIKSAYYKLSKLYHPDKSSDEASAKKFRSITEAYEVLGNIKLKKMYDKGLMVGRENTSRMEYKPEPEPTDPTLKFYKSRLNRQVAPTMDGKTPIYNFDAWSKSHYGDLFQKSKREREIISKRKQTTEQRQVANRQEAIMYVLFAIGGLFVFLVAHGKDDYDRIKNIEMEKSSKT
ncbi:unnamed protein product [Diatraea saccharalis]|uniref:J domain-containing protein n=1 Tax=Diatraea saccharalis TaxID=40085 RepID=A0A9N9R861_9NEOP|nr:unnamed protein product [Diatraea saccharalis]